MMKTSGKLNRSHSESELSKSNIDNLCIQDLPSDYPHLQFEEGTPFVKKTVLIFEEIGVRYDTPVKVRNGQSIPNQLHNIEKAYSTSFLSTRTNNSNSFSRIELFRQVQLNSESMTSNYVNHDNRIMAMDVDILHNNSKPEEADIEKMDVDTDYYTYQEESLNNLDRILKNRKFKRGSLILSENSLENKPQGKPMSHEKKSLRYSIIFLIAAAALMILLYMGFIQDSIIFVNSDIQLQNLKKDISEQVHEQKGAVNVIIRSLELRRHWLNKIKILCFIGSAGVGKTFVANILKKHFHNGLVHELYGLKLNFRDQWENILNRLKSCCLNLIIIDDLKKRDTSELFTLIHSLPKNHYILIISIFNIQHLDDNLHHVIDYDDINEIRHEFDNSGLFHELAIFQPFNMDQVKDWLQKQQIVQNLEYSEKLLNNVLYNHNVSCDGLKGLYSKLLLELEKKS